MKETHKINGREYEYADMTLTIGGVPIVGFREVNYSMSREKEIMFAKGRTGHSIQSGNDSGEGSVTFTQSTLEALELATGGQLLDAHFDMIISYGAEINPVSVASAVVSTDILKDVEFTKVTKGMKQGDKFMEVPMPFIFLTKKSV